jgi:hypothetical protein
MGGRFLVRGVALAATVAIALIVVASAGGNGDSLDPGNHISSSLPLRPDTTFSYGLGFLSNRTDSELTIKKVALVRHSHGLRLVGTRIVTNRVAGGIAVIKKWPPRRIGDLVPVRGFVLKPHEQEVEFVFGAHVRRGRQTFSGIKVTFDGPDGSETDVLPQAFAACAVPKGNPLRPCPTPPPPG